MKLTGKCSSLYGDVELGKRVHLPGLILTDTCPNCTTPYERDFAVHPHLSYPKIGEPIELNAYCDVCGHEWSPGRIIIRVTVEEAPEEPEDEEDE
jgi:hypothetical protein